MHKTDNLPPSCAIVTKYGNLNFLEPFRPIQACNGTAAKHTLQGNSQIPYYLLKWKDEMKKNHVSNAGLWEELCFAVS